MACTGLRTHRFHGFRRGADKLNARLGAGAREGCVLGKKTVEGVEGLGAAVCCGGKDFSGVQIRFAGRRRTDAIRLIRHAYMQRRAVGFGKDGNRANTHLPTGPYDPDGDFTAICYKDFFEHGAADASAILLDKSKAHHGAIEPRRKQKPLSERGFCDIFSACSEPVYFFVSGVSSTMPPLLFLAAASCLRLRASMALLLHSSLIFLS